MLIDHVIHVNLITNLHRYIFEYCLVYDFIIFLFLSISFYIYAFYLFVCNYNIKHLFYVKCCLTTNTTFDRNHTTEKSNFFFCLVVKPTTGNVVNEPYIIKSCSQSKHKYFNTTTRIVVVAIKLERLL